jgi:hypothetical protein
MFTPGAMSTAPAGHVIVVCGPTVDDEDGSGDCGEADAARINAAMNTTTVAEQIFIENSTQVSKRTRTRLATRRGQAFSGTGHRDSVEWDTVEE